MTSAIVRSSRGRQIRRAPQSSLLYWAGPGRQGQKSREERVEVGWHLVTAADEFAGLADRRRGLPGTEEAGLEEDQSRPDVLLHGPVIGQVLLDLRELLCQGAGQVRRALRPRRRPVAGREQRPDPLEGHVEAPEVPDQGDPPADPLGVHPDPALDLDRLPKQPEALVVPDRPKGHSGPAGDLPDLQEP